MTTDDRLENLVHDHGRRAFGLALALTGQASDADDLVQKAVLVAARKRAAIPEEGAWPWFARVITLEARNLRRKARPAVRMEEVMGVEDPGQKDPVRHALDRELVEALGRELAALPDHEREAVALIHVSGLSYREASAALDLSASTLNQRVKAALGRMRKKLELDEAALCSALVFLGKTSPPCGFDAAITRWLSATKASTGAGLASSIGGLIVSKKIAAVAILVVGLFVAGYEIIAGDEPVPLKPAEKRVEVEASDPVRARREQASLDSNETTGPVETEIAKTVYGRVRGRVTDSQGRPRAGIRVRLESPDEKLALEDLEAVTDGEGRYELGPRLAADAFPGNLAFSVVASDDELAGSRRSGLWLEEGLVLEDIDLLVYRPARVSGRIISAETGAGVPGVEIRVNDVSDPARPLIRVESPTRKTRSGEDGAFDFEALAPGRFLPIVGRIDAKGNVQDLHITEVDELELAEGEQKTGFEIEVSTTRLIFRLKDDPGGMVQFHYQVGQGWWNVVSFEKAGTGPYVKEGLLEEVRAYYLSAPGKRSANLKARRSAGPDLDLGVIELVDLPRTGGIVLSASGEPVERAWVRMNSADGRNFSAAVTDEEGRFVTNEIASGSWKIMVTHPEHATLETRRELAEGQLDEVFQLGVPGEIVGRVTLSGRVPTAPERGADGRQQPLRVAVIPADAPLPPKPSVIGRTSQSQVPASDGSFIIRGVTPGRYRVAAGIEKRVAWSDPIEVTAGARAETAIDIAKGGRLRGRVLNGDRPASGLRLRLARNPQEIRSSSDDIAGRCDEDGRYAFDGLPEGVWYLKCGDEKMLSGATVAARRVEIVAGEEKVRDLSIASAQPLLSGRILVGGRSRMKIALLVRPGSPMPVARGGVDREGRFTIDGVADGDYYLWLVDDLYNPKVAHRLAVSLARARPQRQDLDLAAGTLGGSLIGADEAKVSVRPLLEDELGTDAAARFAVIEVAAREGRFEVDHLVAGRYEVVVTAAGQAPVRQEVEVAGATEIQVEIGARGGTLELRVTELRGFQPNDLSGGLFDKLLIVRVFDAQGNEVGVLDESRYLRLTKGSTRSISLGAGTFRVVVQGKLVESTTLDVEIEAGQTRSIDIKPRRAAEYRLQLKGEGLEPALLGRMSLAVLRPDGSRVEEVDMALAAGIQDQEALASGILRVLPLSAGRYRLQIEVPGFEPTEHEITLATSEIKSGTLELERDD